MAKQRRTSSSTKIPQPADGRNDGEQTKVIYTRLPAATIAEINAEVERRGYPHTFTSLVRELLTKGLAASQEEKKS